MKRFYGMLVLLCLMVQGIWAQNSVITVSTAKDLTDAIADGASNIQLSDNIQLGSYLDIDGKTVTIDLNGYTLSRNLTEHGSAGHVIYVHGGSTLTLTSSVAGGSIEGGKANNGGAINIPHGNTVSATNVIFQNNSAADHAGAIWNNGSFTAENCVFENNRASDVGAIYNAVRTEDNVTYAGTATLTGCTFTGNVGTTGAGALANALGATVMTIDGCTIQDNTSGSRGAGIWNGGTLNMKGAVTVKDNKDVGGVVTNVFLKSGKVITVTGSLAGSKIGVDLEDLTGTFTSGYSNYNSGVAPNTIFTIDRSSILALEQDGGEVRLISFNPNPLSYIERSWDDTNKKVVITEKALKRQINDEDTPAEGDYKEVTSAPTDNPEQWLGMGGYSTTVPEYYVVQGDVNRETIVVQGTNVHLILCDGATLTLTGGLKLEGDNKLYIHSQSYGDNMGRLIVTNKYEKAAGIGSARDDGADKTVGELVIYGGHIEAIGGEYGAGIGSCSESGNKQLCNKVTVYGGHIEATGGEHAAGIGGGARAHGGDFILYDGTVIAIGGGGTIKIVKGNWAAALLGSYLNAGGGAGVGGGGITNPKSDPYAGYGGNVTIYGGTLTATGQSAGAGIGSGGSFFGDSHQNQRCGGTFTMYGGTVTAAGGGSEAGAAAGIGGGYQNGGGTVYVSGGTVTATGGQGAAGIGGGYSAMGSEVTITGGTVIATTSVKEHYSNRAIGPGQGSDNFGTLSIGDAMMVGAGNSGSVERIYDADERVNACWYRSYAEISPCSHPAGLTYTINNDGTHTSHSSHCKHCTVTETAEHSINDISGTCICGYKDGEESYYYTITLATSSGSGYEGVGEPIKVGKDKLYTLPVCTTIPEGYDFAGWVVNPQNLDNGIQPKEGEKLWQAGENIEVTVDVTIAARYQPLAISLADNGDNGEKLYTYNGRKAATVTLAGRTLWKDGEWNTLCLPFSLTAAQLAASPLDGATIKTLESSSFDSSNGTLTLNFTPDENNLTAIEAGKPYLVKWVGTSGSVSNPAFHNVTISNVLSPVAGDVVTFAGSYSPVNIGEGGDNTLLYLGGGSTLYYPSTAMSIGSCRAIFRLNGITAGTSASPQSGTVRAFNMHFGDDESTGVTTPLHYREGQGGGSSWFTLDGRRLSGKPSTKGVYINNGKVIIIK